jgi:hypothetical protein
LATLVPFVASAVFVFDAPSIDTWATFVFRAVFIFGASFATSGPFVASAMFVFGTPFVLGASFAGADCDANTALLQPAGATFAE